MDTAELPETLIRPETVRFAPALSVPNKLSALPKVPVPLRLRVVDAATSVEPERILSVQHSILYLPLLLSC